MAAIAIATHTCVCVTGSEINFECYINEMKQLLGVEDVVYAGDRPQELSPGIMTMMLLQVLGIVCVCFVIPFFALFVCFFCLVLFLVS